MAERRKPGSHTPAPQDFGRLFETKEFTVLDPDGKKIGKVEDIYVGGDQQPRYLRVTMGALGMNMTVMPVQLVTNVDSDEQAIHLSVPKDVAKSSPTFDLDHQFKQEDEVTIWEHYGLGRPVDVETEISLWREAS
jgi:hypothetical protein